MSTPPNPAPSHTPHQRASIAGLAAFVDANKRDYVAPAGRFTPQQKDRIEEEVLTTVAAARGGIQRLTDSVVAAQAAGGGGRALINEQTAAHLHGAVGCAAAA